MFIKLFYVFEYFHKILYVNKLDLLNSIGFTQQYMIYIIAIIIIWRWMMDS